MSGVKERTEQDVETGQKLARVLLTQLIGALREEVAKSRHTGKGSPAWHNLIYIAYMVEELVLGSVKELTSSAGERDFKG